MQSSPYPDVRSISCEFQDGVIVLRGQVDSFYLKQVAQETIRNVEGVTVIVNIISVTEIKGTKSLPR